MKKQNEKRTKFGMREILQPNDGLVVIEAERDDSSLPSNEKTTFDSTLYMTWDPFGDRAKIFRQDNTFRVPGKHGRIFDFKNGRVLSYNKF